MMTLSHKDIKDVSHLVTKKLELYANREKRENAFDPFGAIRTTQKMYKYDFMYRVFDYDVWDRKSPRYPKKKKTNESGEDDETCKEVKRQPIHPKVLHNSRRMCLYKEVDRLASNATKVFENLPIDKLQIIHRYRPSYHGKIEDTTETGKVQNYTRHVGSVLKSQDYINYYIKEGLQTGDASKSKRLQEMSKENKNEEDEDKKDVNESHSEDDVKKDKTRKQEKTLKTFDKEKNQKPVNPTIKVVLKKREKTL